MRRQIRTVAVLGSGVMGSAIAAHFANAGVRSLVLDIAPRELNEAEKAAGLTPDHPKVRGRLAAEAVAAMVKSRPSPLFSAERASFITTGNIEDDLPKVREADWIIEVVKEDLPIKLKVLAAVAPHVRDDALLTSNTSGLSLAAMSAVLPAALKPRFLGTHFFNPPRYMKLFEVIPTNDTDPGVLDDVCAFARDRLGKGVVIARDTPNFIANRVGVHAMMATFAVMQELGLTIEEVDALSGPAIGRPKTATFQLADLVGLDTFLHVADNLYPLVPDDEARETFKAPEFVRRMVERGLLGRKSGGGFFRMLKEPQKKLLALDLQTLEYRDQVKAKFPEIEAARPIEDLPARLRQLAFGQGKAGQAIWKMLAASFSYSAMRVGEICDSAAQIDQAVCWGFNWKLGPFETWDALGFRAVTERLRQEKYPLPAWVDALYAAGADALYREVDGVRCSPTSTPGGFAPVPGDARAFDFEILRRTGREVRRNPGASLLDLGDGVLCLEFHSKMNAIGQDHLNMIMTACTEAEKNWQALVVANPSENFSAGANLMMLMMEAAEGNWEDIDLIVRAFQAACGRLEHCGVPVVTAPAGLALGGGCEITLGGNAVRAAAETYIGLVEMGAGVIPAGGGCLRLYLRNLARLTDPRDLQPAFRRTFETIGTAKVATSADEGRDLGFLRPGDTWSMHRDHVPADAKEIALAMARGGFEPPVERTAIPVMGTAGIALAESVLYNMEQGGYATAHDRKLGMVLANVLSGGAVPPGSTITEQEMLTLEREGFMRLIGEPKTLARMESLMKSGKPLRN
ncbi:MAG: 3-hydroxyacyl-CoA dehydrogenase/enoyl-CoA hydratase family protein [bacterium]|jgi:3-hydroxyacyl-CoA dehydrogenase|nr:3-hydroxyacyl-CoA dehydrogenase/enoyl-CoA hydratase family protein [bacterium]